jgi:hypothetical protein
MKNKNQRWIYCGAPLFLAKRMQGGADYNKSIFSIWKYPATITTIIPLNPSRGNVPPILQRTLLWVTPSDLFICLFIY